MGGSEIHADARVYSGERLWASRRKPEYSRGSASGRQLRSPEHSTGQDESLQGICGSRRKFGSSSETIQAIAGRQEEEEGGRGRGWKGASLSFSSQSLARLTSRCATPQCAVRAHYRPPPRRQLGVPRRQKRKPSAPSKSPGHAARRRTLGQQRATPRSQDPPHTGPESHRAGRRRAQAAGVGPSARRTSGTQMEATQHWPPHFCEHGRQPQTRPNLT